MRDMARRTAYRMFRRNVCRTPLIVFVWIVVAAAAVVGHGQATTTTSIIQTSAVGGVSIDTDGLLNTARTDDLGILAKVRKQSLDTILGDLNDAVPMRKVSLRRLDAALEDCATSNKPMPDATKYLAGLQHVRYVFVYPEQKDIVLVGPAEGWRADERGNVVGRATGRPVMLRMRGRPTGNMKRRSLMTAVFLPPPQTHFTFSLQNSCQE
jgi:hypothetical protein